MNDRIIRVDIGPIYDSDVGSIVAEPKVEAKYDCARIMLVNSNRCTIEISLEVLERAIHEIIAVRTTIENDNEAQRKSR